jgi:hypothetical protein
MLRTQQVVIARLVTSSSVDDALKNLRNPQWIYFGRDAIQFCQAKQALHGRGEIINSGALINQIAGEILPDFINFDQHLDLKDDDLRWHTTDLADKTPYTSDFFFHCCAYLAFDQILRALKTDLMVIVEDNYLGWLMARHATGLGFVTSRTTGNQFLDLLPEPIRYFLHVVFQVILAIGMRLYFILEFCRRKLILLKHSRTSPLKKRLRSNDGVDVMLVTWVDSKTFPPDASIERETFFGELPGFLRGQGQRVLYLANPATWVSPFKEILQNIQTSPDRILLPEECFGLREILKIALSTLFFSLKLKSSFVLKAVDVSQLLKDHIRKEKGKWHQCLATRYYYVGKFLSENKIEPAVLLHAYENQPWEKALRMGMKRYLPGTTVVGYQHAPFAPLWLSYYPTRQDLQVPQVPDRLVVIGPRWETLLSELGYPRDRLRVGAALRFDQLMNASTKEASTEEVRRPAVRTILVAASISSEDFFELAYKTIEALRDVPDLKVLIKFHPKMRRNVMGLMKVVLDSLDLKNLPEKFSITDQPLTDLLQTVDLVLHNGTSVAVEAMAQGVPTLLLQSDIWFDMDTLGFFPGVGAAARTPDEIRAAVHRLLTETGSSTQERRRQARAVFEQAFSPVSETNMRCFYEVNGESSGN